MPFYLASLNGTPFRIDTKEIRMIWKRVSDGIHARIGQFGVRMNLSSYDFMEVSEISDYELT